MAHCVAGCRLASSLSSTCLGTCHRRFLQFFILQGLDAVLRGGLPPGVITELVGPAGVGKSQTCYTIALQVSIGVCFNLVCAKAAPPHQALAYE
jgi:ABC-type branched-subunit amino acid transport system ATPase component